MIISISFVCENEIGKNITLSYIYACVNTKQTFNHIFLHVLCICTYNKLPQIALITSGSENLETVF